MFVLGLSELYTSYVSMDYDRGMGPCRLKITVTLCTIPGQRATSDQTKGHTTYHVFFYFRLKLEPEILNCQILSAVLSRTTNTLFHQIATSSSNIIAFEELNDEDRYTVFHA